MTTATATAGRPARRQGARQEEEATAERRRDVKPATRDWTVNLPFVTADFHVSERLPSVSMPHLSMPSIRMRAVRDPAVRAVQASRREVAHAGRVVGSHLPPPERVAYYAGLGFLAVVGLIEWPVAAAIGAGTVIAQRAGRRRVARAERPTESFTESQEGGDEGGASARTTRPARSRGPVTSRVSPAKAAAETTRAARTAGRPARSRASQTESAQLSAPAKRVRRARA
jgi:hypothetical protein